MTGVVLADYFVVHRRELHLGDLYIGNPTSAYWYKAGFNWRAPVAWYVKSPCLSSPFPLPLASKRLVLILTTLRLLARAL